MIHILTVHWKTDFWLAPQIRYLKKYTHNQFKLYSYFTDVNKDNFQNEFFFYSDTDDDDHARKLNKLADIAISHATSDHDLLVFIDSDAFRIIDWEHFINEKLKEFELIAIRRDENFGDVQPHPCFCVTTVGLWKRIRGDWGKGYSWINLSGNRVTDVGGNLLGKLREFQIPWHPLTRSHTTRLHPLWFGIYGNLIYHHGAGSRDAVSRLDVQSIKRNPVLNEDFDTSFNQIRERNNHLSKTIMELVNKDDFPDNLKFLD